MSKQSYNHRRDHRTDAEFKRDIKSRSKKEQFLIQTFKKEMKHRGHEITVRDNGVDNSGEVVQGTTTCAADYVATIDGEETELEVKNSYVGHKCTFKVYNLQKYVEAGASILLFYNTGNINYNIGNMDYDEARWAIITPDAIARMLEDKKDNYYSEVKFGGKICLRIFDSEYATYFESDELTYHRG